MAIQLNERDELIFNLIDEHKVLLEKHIAWFISQDQKPVLIRDRLRKLFYLDYLLCERHSETLPWWTTPTKPLVYSLAPLSRNLLHRQDANHAISSNEIQRHCLEVANLRMLFLLEEKENNISNLLWKTNSNLLDGSMNLDATVTFNRNDIKYNIGILNHPALDSNQLLSCLEESLQKSLAEKICIISRDQLHQIDLQKIISSMSSINHHCAFATHHELYQASILKAKWENCKQNLSALFLDSLKESPVVVNVFNPSQIIIT